MIKNDCFELITIWRGRDSATYLSKDFIELGEKAVPIWVRQYPGVNAPFRKIRIQDTECFYLYNPVTKKDMKQKNSVWDVDSLRKLLKEGE